MKGKKVWVSMAVAGFILAGCYGILISAWNYEKVVSGISVKMETEVGRKLPVSPVNSITYGFMNVEAVSGEYFSMRTLDERQMLFSGPKQSRTPLEWREENYYRLSAQRIPAGQWLVTEGSGITMLISGVPLQDTALPSFQPTIQVKEVKYKHSIGEWISLILLSLLGGIYCFFLAFLTKDPSPSSRLSRYRPAPRTAATQ